MSDFVSRISNKKFSISFENDSKLYLNQKEYQYSVQKKSSSNFILTLNEKTYLCNVVENNDSSFEIVVNGKFVKVISKSLIADKAEEIINSKSQFHSSVMVVKAPMPGLILKIKKQDGDFAERGETVMILEAMKMENEIRAPISGHIFLNFKNEGTAVEKNTVLFEIR